MIKKNMEREDWNGRSPETGEGRAYERRNYSREASNTFSDDRRAEMQPSRRGMVSMAGQRRRRRVSDMVSTSQGFPSRNEQPSRAFERDFGGDYRSNSYEESNSRRSSSSYYRDKYKQQHEGRRQSYGREPRPDYDERRPSFDREQRPDYERRDERQQSRGRYERRDGGSYQGGDGDRRQLRRNWKGGQRNRNQDFKPRRKNVAPDYDEPILDPNEEVRLNKFLSNAGVCSRREADELIKAGAVVVNGVPVTELGTKIDGRDRVEVNGKEIRPEKKVYVLLNKPRNCVTTTDDPQERLTVMHLVRTAANERIYPVGRLDRNTTGVLLLTNDGDLAAKLVHPSHRKKKIYHVWLDKEVSVEDMQMIADGIELEDGEMHADAISYVDEEDRSQVGIEIHSGRNRIVRRIFEHLGYHVVRLDRVYFAGLTKKNLGRGKWRYLTQEEVNRLRMGAFD
ncbi:MAG: pseudouridine synthase [Porphyromonas sp.]|nr:pseudouridine synthase [Porphyromonas sp.]